MLAWRCPRCGAPQPETARCWVCRRSTTCCATCRHFRRAVAAGLGYCGLDRRRAPLQGDELRPCWTGDVAPLLPATAPVAVSALTRPEGRARLAFVPVETLVAAPAHTATPPPVAPRPPEPVSLGWTLWGDAFL